MAFYLSHMTAADFWRLVYDAQRVPHSAEGVIILDDVPCRIRELCAVAPHWLDERLLSLEGGRVHVLVNDLKNRCNSKKTVSHVLSGDIPEGSFYRVNDQLYIASPEFVFLQLASAVAFPQLIAYGCEICGKYAFDPQDEDGTRQRKLPLVTPEQLRVYLEAASGVRGLVTARRALGYVAAGSESPMETASYLFLSLPYRMGGYGLRELSLNQEVPLTQSAQIVAKRENCRPDIRAGERRIDIEYAGRNRHTGNDALEWDSRRSNALSSMGFEIVHLTKGQVDDWRTFEQIALNIASKMDKRIEKKYRGPLPERMKLRKMIAIWNKFYGRSR